MEIAPADMRRFVDEAYRRFPDVVEPCDDHPAGKIVEDKGSLRYAFLVGAEYGANQQETKT